MKKTIREYTHSSKQSEYESKIYKLIPPSEDYVDDMEFSFDLGEEYTNFVKSCVKEAIQRIRLYLVKTRNATSVDFRRAFNLLIETKTIEKIADRLKVEISQNKNDATSIQAGSFSRDDKRVSFNYYSFRESEKAHSRHIAIHEFLHYFTIMFDPEFKEGGNRYVFGADFENPFTSRPGRYINIYEGKTLKDSHYVYSPFSDCNLLNEGYNELIAFEMDDDSRLVSYYIDIVKMADFLQFVTGQEGNYRDFFRRTLKTQIGIVGMEKFLKFVDHLNEYEEDRNERSDYNYNKNKNYLSAQAVLVDFYIEKLKKGYTKNKNTEDFVKGILELLGRIPVLDEETTKEIEEALNHPFINQANISKSDFASLQVTRSLVRKNAKRNRVMIELDNKNVDLSFALINGGISLFIYGIEIGEQWIQNMKNADTFVVDRGNFSTLLMKFDDKLFLRFMRREGENFSLIKEAYIDLSEIEKGNIVYKPNDEFRKNFSFRLYDADEYKEVDQTASFMKDSKNLMKFLGNVDMKGVKNVRVIEVRESYKDTKQIYILEESRGNVNVYTSQNGGQAFQNNIVNANFFHPGNNREIFAPKYRIDEDEKRIFVDLAASGKIDDEAILTIILDNGLVLQKVKIQGSEKFIVFSKGQRIDYGESIVYSENNTDLKFYIETKQKQAASKPISDQDESGN